MIGELAAGILACWMSSGALECPESPQPQVAAAVSAAPEFVGESLDVVLSAESVLVWDETSGTTLYGRATDTARPVASLTKLLTALLVRERLALDDQVEIPKAVRSAQRRGAHVRLPPGHHATVEDLLSAGLIASANDAMVTLALAVSPSEELFAAEATQFAQQHGMPTTQVANATGLSGGEQYSTARDVRRAMELAAGDPALQAMLADPAGELVTIEGAVRDYTSTNQLLKTYVPTVAAKTGYTPQAKQNLVLITEGAHGQRVGAVVLGSDDRFQDMKVLIEWIWRNWRWPASAIGG